MKKIGKKLAIIGSAPTRFDAPYDDKDFDIWAVSGAAYSQAFGTAKKDKPDGTWDDVRRVDVFFEMHKLNAISERIPHLNHYGFPVVMQNAVKEIPTSEAYPINEIVDAIGDDFFSSVSYMLAYGIYLGYEEIRLYGIILLHETEYIRQRPSVKYFIGVAKAKGIKVWAPEDTQLTSSAWRYGYDDIDEKIKLLDEQIELLKKDMETQDAKIKEERAKYFQFQGGMLECQDLKKLLTGGLA